MRGARLWFVARSGRPYAAFRARLFVTVFVTRALRFGTRRDRLFAVRLFVARVRLFAATGFVARALFVVPRALLALTRGGAVRCGHRGGGVRQGKRTATEEKGENHRRAA